MFRRRLRRSGFSRRLEMGDDEALQRLERIRFLGMIEGQNLVRRGFRRRVGELLAVGKDALKLDVRVEVAEQNLRRGRPLERKRRLDEQKKRRESQADGYDWPHVKCEVSTARTHAGESRLRRRRFGRAGPERAL